MSDFIHQELIDKLRQIGVPVDLKKSHVEIVSPTSLPRFSVKASVMRVDFKPVKAIITANNDSYIIPEDDISFSDFLYREQDMVYYTLRILAAYGVSVENDVYTKTFRTITNPEDEQIVDLLGKEVFDTKITSIIGINPWIPTTPRDTFVRTVHLKNKTGSVLLLLIHSWI